VKVHLSPYERAVNTLAQSHPKLADELEAACRRDMAKELALKAERDAALKERDEARADVEDLKQHARETNARLNAALDILTQVERGPLLANADTTNERAQMRVLWEQTVRSWARELLAGRPVTR
jgi:uncharacterized protein YhaN